MPVLESHSTDPISSYGVLKLTAEKYIQMYSHLYGVDARILRVANAYGPRQPLGRSQGVVGGFVDAACATSRCGSSARAARCATTSTWTTSRSRSRPPR